MYSLPYFKAANQNEVFAFMQAHSFAMVIGSINNKPVATQVPLLLKKKEEGWFMQGHIMKNTDHYKAFLQNNEVLTVFTGAHSYVSASWYTDPKTASTWNYQSVHAYGNLEFKDELFLRNLLAETTEHFEGNPDSPAAYKNLTEDYISKLVKAIMAFEIRVTSIDHVFKLSQNRDKKSYHQIIEQLEKQGGEPAEVALAMMKNEENVFDKKAEIK